MTALLLLLIGQLGIDVPPTAEQEILRRGNMIEQVAGPEDGLQDFFGPPASDANKWFLTVWLKPGDPASDRLAADWQTSKHLLAWAKPDSAAESWAHLHFYRSGDPAQKWREERYRLSRFPAVIIQPPLDGSYGDPKTIVAQIEGYDGRPEYLSQLIRSAILRYVAARRSEGHAQAEKYTPPFEVAPRQQQRPSLVLPAVDEPAPPAALESILLRALGSFLGSSSLQTILLAALIAVQLWREYRRKNGLPLLLDDQTFARIVEAVRRATNNNVQS